MENSFRIPKGWFIGGDGGNAPDGYDIGVDPSLTYNNQPCVTIKAKAEPTEFAALVQHLVLFSLAQQNLLVCSLIHRLPKMSRE